VGEGALTGRPLLPGGVGISRLRVYDTPAPDGLVGGSAHVHLASTEAYVVVGGRGSVQTLGPAGFEETPLAAGAVVWFSPGVVHRLVSAGDLEIVVVMQNAGLPEAGDAVLTFPDPVLADASAYAAAAVGDTPEAARRRRDFAIEGFTELRARAESDGDAALRAFYSRAVELVRGRVGAWEALLAEGPRRATEEARRRVELLRDGRLDHLLEAAVASVPPEARLGMCGTLDVYDAFR